MTQSPIDLRSVKRKVAQAFFRDGLFELLTGLMLVFMGILAAIPDKAYLVYLPWLLLTVIFPAARKRWVAPRVGFVSAPDDRSRLRLMIGLAVLMLVGLAVVLLGFGDRQSRVTRAVFAGVSWLVEHAPLVGGLGLAAFLASVGWRTDFVRMWAYTGVALVAAIGVSVFPTRLGMRILGLLVIVGGVLFLWGLAVFRRFLRDHPIRPESGSGLEEAP